ncbi:MmgE/PrpD family protein [Actinophytocola sp.]|uniref:MmgE/PrpD family protein n=1 Tax=Actinophytocola sp. TaxID=1872138 RepID=UPI003D6BE5CC
MTTTAVGAVADFALSTVDISGVVHEYERCILNAFGAAGNAARTEPIDALRRVAGPGPCTAIFSDRGHPVEETALINAATIHLLDFDDTYVRALCHATSPVLGAVLAAAQAAPGPVSGREFLEAFAVGFEVEVALADILWEPVYDRGFHVTPFVGAPGVAAAISRLWRLTPAQARHAIGISVTGAVSYMENFGSHVKAYGIGNSTRSGIRAVQLAMAGFTSMESALDGPSGMLRALATDPARIDLGPLAELGRNWRVRDSMLLKYYSTGTIMQAALQAALAERPKANGTDVAAIRVRGFRGIRQVCVPERPPASSLEAKFDFPYCVAAAWVDGQFLEHQMSADRYLDQEVLRVRSLVDVVTGDELGPLDCDMEIELVDGRTLSSSVRQAKGSPQAPLTDSELEDKLRLSTSDLPVDPKRIADEAWRLESAPSLEPLQSSLTPSPAHAGARSGR